MTDFVRYSVHTRRSDVRACCDWCESEIRKGDTYCIQTGTYEGQFTRCRYHASCLQFAAPGQAANYGWYSFGGGK